MSDLNILRELERIIDNEIKKVDFKEISIFDEKGKACECVIDKKTNCILALKLEGINISSIPNCICELKNLQKLYLDCNQFTTLPDCLGELKNLQELYLNFNQFTTLPDCLGELKNLQGLYLSDNQFTTLPKCLGELKNLQVLFLISNQLTTLPDWLGELKNLQELYLSCNQFTTFPECLGELKNLQQLYLGYNKLIEIPETIASLDKLVDFELEENDTLLSPPPSVVSEGMKAIRRYFKNEMERVHTCKMVVVGEGGMGKTCLLDSLEGKEFDPVSNTTHGIEIRKLSMSHPTVEGITMELNVWDFGGQDIYHATHQFYLTNYSLFVLVWSARHGYEVGKVYKWLETISVLAPESPVLIVATHAKDRGADLPKGDILAKYNSKVRFFAVDNENRDGMEDLKEAIRNAASELKYMGIGRPKSWMKAKAAIQDLSKKYIGEKQLLNIFKKSGVDKNSNGSLAVYLHEMGDILYYPEEEDLKDTVIIKPAWVSQHIAKVLDSEQVSIQQGFLNKSLMRKLWKDLSIDIQGKFVRLMEKFDLSYNVPDSDETKCLIVEKLKYEEHWLYKEKWEGFQGDREIVFKYIMDTVPAGIPTWFIARTHRFSMLVHWRTGVVLVDDKDNPKHMGLVTVDRDRKEVWLKVKGKQPYYFFSLLRDTLELTFKRFPGLKFIPYVPCHGHDGQPCTNYFKLEHLEKSFTMKPPQYDIQCMESLKSVKVVEHLYGISYIVDNIEITDAIVDKLSKKLDEQSLEFKKYIQLEFIKNYQVQQKLLDKSCPNLFTLKPLDLDWMHRAIEADEFELQLYCQKPGCIHAVKDGKYKIKVTKKWVKAIAGYYNKMAPILKSALPVVAPGVGAFLECIKLEDFSWVAKSGGEMGKVMRKMDVETLDIDIQDGIINAEGSELRMLYELLVKLDTNKSWGGLERVVTPEGHILWLCEEHKGEYKL